MSTVLLSILFRCLYCDAATFKKHIKSNVDDDIDKDIRNEENNNSTKVSALAYVET